MPLPATAFRGVPGAVVPVSEALQLFLSMNRPRAFSEGEIIPIIFCEQVTALSDLSLLEAR